ncbi:partner of bursicon-like [Littorina saxatilis]|uniref:Uncharacterized protein n=1 Tax=Littorina saxatilis TaxID=31220 RepID=A0AAN9BS49_9CAEN
MTHPRPDNVTLSSVTLVLTLTLTLTLQLVASQNDNCQLIHVRENIVKEMTLSHSNRNVLVSCTAEIDLHKCEGYCQSQVLPTVLRRTGFRMDCRCCREGSVQTRTVVLPQCYHNGELMEGLEGTVEVTDLLSCDCFACTN